jgi:SAM-dependent MidA family methyltransferase
MRVLPMRRLPSPMSMLPLTQSEPDALHAALCARIRDEIARAGPISFARFMELALYAPGLGYYSAGLPKFGRDGDFVTAPELGDVFARCLAHGLVPALREIPHACVLEPGAGSGALAADFLLACEALGWLPERYWILERSASLRQQQRETLQSRAAHLIDRVAWLDAPPSGPWRGALIANELIDALPVERFAMRGGLPRRLYVSARGEAFDWVEGDFDPAGFNAISRILETLPGPLPDGYRSEYLPGLAAMVGALTAQMQQGHALFIDYGYARSEYYSRERGDGTLICHRRHRADNDPLAEVGLKDLTAFVDFTALAEAGTACGLDFAGYTSQAQFLLASGLAQVLEAAQALPLADRHGIHNQARRLTLPGEMGERFQVMGFSRASACELPGFALSDLSHRL